MTESEINAFGKLLRRKAAEFKKNPQEARDFLVRAGILTKGGKLSKAYRRTEP